MRIKLEEHHPLQLIGMCHGDGLFLRFRSDYQGHDRQLTANATSVHNLHLFFTCKVDQIRNEACRLVLPSSCKPEGPTYMYPYTDAVGRLFELLSPRALRVPSWRSASQALALLGQLRCQCLLTATEQVQDSLRKLIFLDLCLNGSILRSEALARLLEGVQALQGCMLCNRSEAFCCDQLCDQI